MPQLPMLALVALAAVVYSSIGFGGASAYLAILSLYGVPHAELSTSALVLNILVAGVAAFNFARAGHLSGRVTWPFVIASVPAAFLGGRLPVGASVYGLLLAVSLFLAALRLWWSPEASAAGEEGDRPVSWSLALVAGAAIGVLSGIVGVGGGIFLSPLIILAGWAGPRRTAATAAVFIVVNSIAGLVGRAARGALVVGDLGLLIAVAFAGGVVGSRLGARRLLPVHLRRVLALILLTVAYRNFRLWLGAL